MSTTTVGQENSAPIELCYFSSTDLRDDLRRIDVPTWIVHGTDDRIVPFAVSGKRTAELVRGSKLAAIEDAPHRLNWTHASKVDPELVYFLGR